LTIAPSLSNNTSRRLVISYRPQLTHVFFHLNNSSGNKWFNFKIPSQNVCTIVSFPTCFSTGYLKPIVLEFYHILAQGQVLDLQLNQFFLALTSFFNLFCSVSNTTWNAPSPNCKYPLMCVHTSHQPYRYPPLTLCSWQRAHMNPWCSSQHLCYHCVRC